MARAELQDLLRQLYCYPEPTLNENESLSAILLPVPQHKKPFLVEDQCLWLGWGLLRWARREAKAALPEEFSVNRVDPALAHLLTAYPESENYETRANALGAAVAPFLVVFIPIFASMRLQGLGLAAPDQAPQAPQRKDQIPRVDPPDNLKTIK